MIIFPLVLDFKKRKSIEEIAEIFKLMKENESINLLSEQVTNDFQFGNVNFKKVDTCDFTSKYSSFNKKGSTSSL